MSSVLRVLGVIVLVLGLIGAFIISNDNNIAAGISTGLFVIIGGSLLLGFAELIDAVKNIEAKLVGRKETVPDKIFNANEFYVRSSVLEVFEPDEQYSFIILNDNQYLRGRVFKNYIAYSDNEYHFSLPNKNKIVLIKEDMYIDGCDLFDNYGVLFVRLEALGIKAKVGENTIHLHYS